MPTPDSPLRGAHLSLTPADAIRLWMDHYGLSETDAALATGLPANTITRLVRGSQPITDEIAEALASVTNVAAWRWTALQRHHAVWTASANSLLAAVTDGQEPTVLPIRHVPLAPSDSDGRPRPGTGVTTKGFGYVQFTDDHDQEAPVGQTEHNRSREIPLHSSTTLYDLADIWQARIELGAGPETTASVLVELATLMRATGISYLNPSDLETLAVGVRSVGGGDVPAAEPDTASEP